MNNESLFKSIAPALKDKVIFTLKGVDANKELLKNSPHILINDMAYTYRIFIEKNDDGISTIPITNEIMKLMQLDLKSLHALAQQNTPNILPAKFRSMNSVIFELMGIDENDPAAKIMDLRESEKFFILSNNENVNGAAAIFYPGQLDLIMKEVKNEFYVLPSSTHEVLIVPKSENISSYKELEKMVKEVNNTEVLPEEILSYNVYEYNGNSKELLLAKDSEKQVESSLIQGKSTFDKMIESQHPSMDLDVDAGYDM